MGLGKKNKSQNHPPAYSGAGVFELEGEQTINPLRASAGDPQSPRDDGSSRLSSNESHGDAPRSSVIAEQAASGLDEVEQDMLDLDRQRGWCRWWKEDTRGQLPADEVSRLTRVTYLTAREIQNVAQVFHYMWTLHDVVAWDGTMREWRDKVQPLLVNFHAGNQLPEAEAQTGEPGQMSWSYRTHAAPGNPSYPYAMEIRDLADWQRKYVR
jgi:hypothetical protein